MRKRSSSPGPQSVRVRVRPRVRRPVRGRLPPRLDRRAHRDPRAEAVRHGTIRRRIAASGHDKILSLGVTLRLGTSLTPAFGLAELRAAGFEAAFLSVGVSKGRDLQVPGVELDGVVKAVD
jgi:hypothetical protein